MPSLQVDNNTQHEMYSQVNTNAVEPLKVDSLKPEKLS